MDISVDTDVVKLDELSAASEDTEMLSEVMDEEILEESIEAVPDETVSEPVALAPTAAAVSSGGSGGGSSQPSLSAGLPQVSKFIDADGGGSLGTDDAELDIPPGALDEDNTLTITEEDPSGFPDGDRIVGNVFDLGPEGLDFDEPVTFTINYDETEDEEGLDVYYLDDDTWVGQGAEQDTEENTLTLELEHFSHYAVLPPSNIPLKITDLEGAVLSMAVVPTSGFEINFFGGTDFVTYSDFVNYGSIPGVNTPSYSDGDTATSVVPFIMQPAEDEIAPVFSVGDTVTLTYDGGNELIVYFPMMDGSVSNQDFYVADDGSLYFQFDEQQDTLFDLAFAALSPPVGDTDNDGVDDDHDNCVSVINPGQEDSDGPPGYTVVEPIPVGGGSCGDNVCDVAEYYSPFPCSIDCPDGIGDVCDNCPSTHNGNQQDTDGDGIGDACDVQIPDQDNDGIADEEDNCPGTANAGQEDYDADGFGNACDPDDDNDGFVDENDICPLENPQGQDANTDGCTDVLEDLPGVVGGLELHSGTENSLVSKVDNALASIAEGNVNAAENKLEAFINEVEAQAGKKITEEDAAMLIAFVQQVIYVITQPEAEDPHLDFDADGVLNERDNCPFIPNADQTRVCDNNPEEYDGTYVFLRSRTFMPEAGIDNALKGNNLNSLPDRVHILLYLEPVSSTVLMSEQKAELKDFGVTLLTYIPHYAYTASMPKEKLRDIERLSYIKGIAPILPDDKINPALRLRRNVVHGLHGDGTVDVRVTFFEDVTELEQEAYFSSQELLGASQDLYTWVVTTTMRDVFKILAFEDIISWIDDLPGEPVEDLATARAAINIDTVHSTYGYTGDGYNISMTEIKHPRAHGDFGSSRTIRHFTGTARSDHATMVAGTLFGDGFLGGPYGVLPDADHLISFSNIAYSMWNVGHRFPTIAKEDFGALFNSNSWSQAYLCGYPGEYTSLAKWFDTSVNELPIPILRSAGNGRGILGRYARHGVNCTKDLYSLGRPASKNNIMVGNVDIFNALSPGSSAGPTADERLKPDVVATGTLLLMPNDTNTYDIASGTSFSTPLTAGVLGMLIEAYADFHGISEQELFPSTLKAILIHTALDDNSTGPDYYYGYGTVQADDAIDTVKLAEGLVIQDTYDSGTSEIEHTFDVNQLTSQFKVTMAYDDKPGSYESTLTLQNDLDLELESPNGTIYYPWDTYLYGDFPIQAVAIGAQQCPILRNYTHFIDSDDFGYVEYNETVNRTTCEDRRNNVEQVVVTVSSGALESGTWIARVSSHRLESDAQNYSLVFDSPCPIILTSDTTLTGDIECPYEVAETAVILRGNNIDLNCDGYSIIGSGASPPGSGRPAYVGIEIEDDFTSVINCTITGFDIGVSINDYVQDTDLINNSFTSLGSYGISDGPGTVRLIHDNVFSDIDGTSIKVGSNSSGYTITNNTFRETEFGIRANTAEQYIISDNLFTELSASAITLGESTAGTSDNNYIYFNNFSDIGTYGVVLRGSTNFVFNNTLADIDNTGIYIGGPSDDGYVIFNHIRDADDYGIELIGDSSSDSVGEMTVAYNDIAFAQDAAIIIRNHASENNVSFNTISDVGRDGAGIKVAGASSSIRPFSNFIHDNYVDGEQYNDGMGIELIYARSNLVKENILTNVSYSMVESNSLGNTLYNNILYPDVQGISLQDNRQTVVEDNLIVGGQYGIYGLADRFISFTGNTILESTRGIFLWDDSFSDIILNTISNASTAGMYFIDVFLADVSNNTISNTTFDAIRYDGGNRSTFSYNTISEAGRYGLSIEDVDVYNFSNNTVSSTVRGVYDISSIAPLDAAVNYNVFQDSSQYHAYYRNPQDADYNSWDDILDFRIYDTNGDSYGDCGADYPYTATTYSGTVTGAAVTSDLVHEVVDRYPVTSLTYAAPTVSIMVTPSLAFVDVSIDLVTDPYEFFVDIQVTDEGNGTSYCDLYVNGDYAENISTSAAGSYTTVYEANSTGSYFAEVKCWGSEGDNGCFIPGTDMFALSYAPSFP